MSPTSSRPPLVVLMVLHTVFSAVRAALVRLVGEAIAAAAELALSQGRPSLCRSIIERAPVLPGEPSMHDSDLATVLFEALSAAEVAVAASTAPRSFYARVSLMGHHDLGVCHVREERLSGAETLLVSQLCEEPRKARWVNPRVVFDLEELSEGDAMAIAAEAQRERDAERAVRERRLQHERAAQEERRTLRSQRRATVQAVGEGHGARVRVELWQPTETGTKRWCGPLLDDARNEVRDSLASPRWWRSLDRYDAKGLRTGVDVCGQHADDTPPTTDAVSTWLVELGVVQDSIAVLPPEPLVEAQENSAEVPW